MDNKKTEKRLCWSCDGNVSLHLPQCPYCGVDLSLPRMHQEENPPYNYFASPFQTSNLLEGSIPKPPYGEPQSNDLTVTDEEWKKALNEEDKEEGPSLSGKRELTALLLLFPGIVFILFGLILTLFSSGGTLTLQWNQSLAYFYFLGSVPLLYLGWRAFR